MFSESAQLLLQNIQSKRTVSEALKEGSGIKKRLAPSAKINLIGHSERNSGVSSAVAGLSPKNKVSNHYKKTESEARKKGSGVKKW